MISMTSSRLPAISTFKTSGIDSIASFNSRANLSKARSGISPARVTTRMGNNATLTSLITGSSVPAGNFAFAISTFCNTSCKARSLSNPASNSSIIEAWPSEAVAVISFKPSIVRSSFSIGRIKSRSPSSGEIPS